MAVGTASPASVRPALLVLGPFLVDRVRREAGGPPVDVPGGNGLVVASVAARLGWPTALVGQLAGDALGDVLRGALLSSGVELIQQEPEPGLETKRAEILVDREGAWRTVATHPGRYPYLQPPGPDALVGRDAVLATGLCSLWRSGPVGLRAWLLAVRGDGLPLGVGLNRLLPEDAPLVDAAVGWDDRLFCNRKELMAWRGLRDPGLEALCAAVDTAPGGELVVSLGADGVLVRPRGLASVHLPADAATVRSSLGAGDVLCATTTVLRLAGVPLVEAAALAQRAATRSVLDGRWDRWLDDDPRLVAEIRAALG